jgi:ribosomal protein S18 acetylase RimI-like enzyme
MSSLRVRIASEQDIAFLLTMMESFNALEQVSWDPRVKERALRTLVADQSLGVVGILSAPHGAVGYFVVTWGYDLEWDGREAFLTELFLVPQARGQGFGNEAMKHLEAVAREHGARALHLMVRDENVIARRLYETHGYVSPSRIFLSKQLASSAIS